MTVIVVECESEPRIDPTFVRREREAGARLTADSSHESSVLRCRSLARDCVQAAVANFLQRPLGAYFCYTLSSDSV